MVSRSSRIDKRIQFFLGHLALAKAALGGGVQLVKRLPSRLQFESDGFFNEVLCVITRRDARRFCLALQRVENCLG